MSLNTQSLLVSIGTGFGDIDAAYTGIDDVSSLLRMDVTSDLSDFKAVVSSRFQQMESHVSTAVAGVASATASEAAFKAAKVVSNIVSHVSILANDIQIATPTPPHSLANDQKGLRRVHGRAIFREVVGIFLIIFASFTFLLAPFLTRTLYRGRFFGTQNWLFGFEGYLDIETIETQIFGARLRRLRWSEYGSSLSRYTENEFDKRRGVDPTTDFEVHNKVEDAITNTNANAMRIFTLIDTNTMTVTLFEALRPPVAVLLCAKEGGMQRALACFYDWTTGTCYRETVLRMETSVLTEMPRVSRVRVGRKLS